MTGKLSSFFKMSSVNKSFSVSFGQNHFIMGGYQKDEESKIMDILLFKNGKFSNDHQLPWGLAESCALPLEDRSSIMIMSKINQSSL